VRKLNSVVNENSLQTQLKNKAKNELENGELLKLFFSFENLKTRYISWCFARDQSPLFIGRGRD